MTVDERKNHFLKNYLDELNSCIKSYKTVDADISKVSVGWHIGHSLKVIRGVVKLLEESDPAAYKRSFNLSCFVILNSGKIPRGIGRSPKSVRPPEEISEEYLKSLMSKTQEAIEHVKNLDSNSHFDHPYFGILNLKKAKRFMEVHTRHHIEIIRDILKKAQA
jgi:hypothetical protein